MAIESATAGIMANAPKLKNVPTLMVFGDYVDQHPRWAAFKKIDLEYADAVRAAGGIGGRGSTSRSVGIKGNSHMLMQDKNNAQIADFIQKWLAGKGHDRLNAMPPCIRATKRPGAIDAAAMQSCAFGMSF